MEADGHRERLEDAAFLALKMDGENKVKKKKMDGGAMSQGMQVASGSHKGYR